MSSSRPKVVLDANVLFPFSLRDTLLRAAEAGFIQIYWSSMILEETRRNLAMKTKMSEQQAERLVRAMTNAFPEAHGEGFESLIPAMPNDEKDRHVAALAVKVGADAVVTMNLKDFDQMPDEVGVQSPDELLCSMADSRPVAMLEIVAAQAAALTRPPRTLDEFVTGLAATVPSFARRMRAMFEGSGVG